MGNEFDSLLKLPLAELIAEASKIRKKYLGNRFEICSIFNAKSGTCSEDCRYCAQSAHYSTSAPRFPLKEKQEILMAAENAQKNGAERISIVTSGNRLADRELIQVAEVCREIREKVEIGVCASLGAVTKQELRILKEAGITRYHHNIETSEHFYPQVVSTHTFRDRVKTINAAKEIGLEVCSGGIIGMGESWQDRIDMALKLRELNVDSVPINILIAIKGTPLEKIDTISCTDIVRTISVFRMILKDRTIKIAAGRETILKDFQALGFMAGANGMLVGGYLTVNGRGMIDDSNLIKELRKMWSE